MPQVAFFSIAMVEVDWICVQRVMLTRLYLQNTVESILPARGCLLEAKPDGSPSRQGSKFVRKAQSGRKSANSFMEGVMGFYGI
jgi:hypothetical protein